MFAVNGILFNHESPRRGETFVSRKISMAAARIAAGSRNTSTWAISMRSRDWGYAKEYVEAMWLMLQADEPDDYVVATGTAYSVRDFLRLRLRARGARVGGVRAVRRAVPATDRSG
jgi:GDPmannose 4,6-dehydratase